MAKNRKGSDPQDPSADEPKAPAGPDGAPPPSSADVAAPSAPSAKSAEAAEQLRLAVNEARARAAASKLAALKSQTAPRNKQSSTGGRQKGSENSASATEKVLKTIPGATDARESAAPSATKAAPATPPSKVDGPPPSASGGAKPVSPADRTAGESPKVPPATSAKAPYQKTSAKQVDRPPASPGQKASSAKSPPPTRVAAAPAESPTQNKPTSASAAATAPKPAGDRAAADASSTKIDQSRQTPAPSGEAMSNRGEAMSNRQPQTAPLGKPFDDFTLLSDQDLHLFNEGTHQKLYEKLGAHIAEVAGVRGTNFGVWAPNAAAVSVIGDFNGWDPRANALEARGNSGIWEGFLPRLERGTVYKYHLVSRHNNYEVDKADPFAFLNETPPRTASVVWNIDYQWNDHQWMRNRGARNALDAPSSIYELHIGSWRRTEDNRPLSYREMAEPLADYLTRMGFTHVEFLPVMEHPFYGSWGYQVTGFFSPTSRYGTPQDLMYLIDVLHQRDIGVILDWVPSHFPSDEHGLAYFDGTHLFEHADPRKGFHPDWGSLIFNYGRNEVRSFLLSSAMFWVEKFHADGLRVDAVASMLYLDYSRKQGEWIPNEFGGRENIEAISFLRRVNEDVYKSFPDVQVIAEESTAWPMVSRPTYVGGLGFGMKWDMGWMHDMLRYMSNDPIHRKYHHNDLTFRMMYAFTENFVLPLSHDEVVHGKGSLINKMPGDDWRKFANLRLLLGYMFAQPGKKLLFMGGEFGQWREWNHDAGLDWHLLGSAPHAALQRWAADLNAAYRDIPAFYELDTDPSGFEWIDCCDTEQSVVTLLRRSRSSPDQFLIGAFNFTPIVRHNYQIGVPAGGRWREVLNSDAVWYGGSGQGNLGSVTAAPIPLHGRRYSVVLTLPPLSAVFLVNDPNDPVGAVDLDIDVESDVEEVVTA